MVEQTEIQDVANFSAEDNNAIIEEMLKAKPAPEPGAFMGDRIIHSGDTDLPVPMIADSLVSAGHVYVYDTKTGEESQINRNMLGFQMMKTHPDGTRAFTLKKPDITPARGSLLCMLHPDAPNRKEYDRWGFKVCPKANLMTEADVEQHMKARHKREWATIEKERVRGEKEADRALQRETLKAMTAMVKASTPPVEKKPRKAKAKAA